MTRTRFAMDDVALELAEASGASWHALSLDDQDGFRRMAEAIEHRLEKDLEVDVERLSPFEEEELAELRRLESALSNLIGQHADPIAEVKRRLELEREEGRKDALVPSRSTARGKGLRLLIEGRLIVKQIDTEKGFIVAECRGDSGRVYSLGYDPRGKGQWRCTCEELRGNCSHLSALKTVTALPSTR